MTIFVFGIIGLTCLQIFSNFFLEAGERVDLQIYIRIIYEACEKHP